MCLAQLLSIVSTLQTGKFIVVKRYSDEPAGSKRAFYIAQIIDPTPSQENLDEKDEPTDYITGQFWATQETSRISYGLGPWAAVWLHNGNQKSPEISVS